MVKCKAGGRQWFAGYKAALVEDTRVYLWGSEGISMARGTSSAIRQVPAKVILGKLIYEHSYWLSVTETHLLVES